MAMVAHPPVSSTPNTVTDAAMQTAFEAITRPQVATSKPRVMRRRPTRTQGQALETLGHAVEYLIDSRLATSGPATSGEEAAIQILMHSSRAVFAECDEIVPFQQKLRRWFGF
jgi:hypothetical protein